MPLVSVWASCERCHFVWRASILDTMRELASRGARRTIGETVVDRYAPVHPVHMLSEEDAGLVQPGEADRVAEWLASQERSSTLKLAPIAHVHDEPAGTESDPVEEFINHLDPGEPASVHGADDFYSFFAEGAPPVLVQDQSVEQWMGGVPEDAVGEQASSDLPAPVVVAAVLETAVTHTAVAAVPAVAEEDVAAPTPLEETVDQALTSVEDLYETFKRLEAQLGGMEKWCADLASTPDSR